MTQKAIIVGATGLIGAHLTEQLAGEETFDEILTLTRRPQAAASTKVHNHIVNFDRLEEAAPLFQANTLFSCLGTTRKQAGSLAAQYRVDVEYQYKAAQMAAEAGVSHYLLVSSSGANSKSASAYLRMKGELEEKIKKLPFERISILQPSLLLGNRGDARPGEQIGAILLPLICKLPGLKRYRPIEGREVAAKMVRLSQQEQTGIETLRLDQLFTS
ncbi:short chain dehydrogenase [Microbulbifer sp. A4B17]|uniref:NAD-dependent epimerase/dehydratase family protein n=1 Tax=Microbulbifer sp. A4B17 TaxID=359370 RepID=UPI000D52AFF7|nr:NAD-dependent epimerase/dehydratase family protein [Microbulbifer sp. A4B17]AWF81944.1 short chain dehydrogenase [Microbulbifer sp. A4B17]